MMHTNTTKDNLEMTSMKKTFRLIIPVFAALILFTVIFINVPSADTITGTVPGTAADEKTVQKAVSGTVSDIAAGADSDTTADTVPDDVSDTVPEAVQDTANNADTDAGSSQKILTVHYLDVGQADSILIQSPSGKTMLIDAGNRDDSEFVKSYVGNLGIEKIDIMIGTHPHEDHIGGMEAVIEAFDIGRIYMPKATASTKTYKNLLTAIKNKKLKVTPAVLGRIDFDTDLEVDILAPNSGDYKDLNDFSVVVKLTYSEKAFLFTGDAEEVSEKEILDKGYNVKADVLKVGHHGSISSTSAKFLKAVSPEYAVISVGQNNDYGLPDETILERLETANIKVFRTDTDGTIIAKSDGRTVTFNKEKLSGTDDEQQPHVQPGASENKSSADIRLAPEPAPASEPDADKTVYYTRGGKSYHYSKDCPTLSRSKEIIKGKLSDALKAGKSDPCDRCVK